MIHIENGNKTYFSYEVKKEALKDIDLSVKKGEFLAVMGTSGSGKSTLLHILGCMDRLTTGKYMFDETEVSSLSVKKWHEFRRKHISFVFQNFALINQYTVRENIMIPLKAQRIRKKERDARVEHVAEVLGITEVLDKLPLHISGGQQQRTAIARAVVCDNELLLCDEPTGALDRNTGIEVMGILKDIHKSGKTIIMVTHDNNVAEFADRIIQIEDGRILKQIGQSVCL